MILTHSYIASISSTFSPLLVQHLAQGHFSMQMGKTGIDLLTFWLEDDHPTAQPQLPQNNIEKKPVFSLTVSFAAVGHTEAVILK